MIRLTLSALLLCAVIARADAPPTMDELRQLEASDDWRTLVQATSRVLQLKDSTGYDRAEVHRMKAEAHVQQKQFSVAADAMGLAAKEKPFAGPAGDRFAALSLLYRVSDARGYKPPATKAEPKPDTFDVLDPANRDRAMAALWRVRSDELMKDIGGLGDRSQLDKFASVCRDALELRPLERVVSGGRSPECDKAIVDTQARFADRANRWSATTRESVEAVAARANEIVTERGDRRRRGLKGQDQMTLASAQDGCRMWVGSANTLVNLLDAEASPAVQAVRPTMQALEQRASAVLTARYGKVSSREEQAETNDARGAKDSRDNRRAQP